MQDAGTAQLHGLDEILFVVIGGCKKDDLSLRRTRLYASQDRQAVHARELEVHENNIGLEEDGFIDSLDAVDGLSDDLNGLMLPENTAQALQDNRLSVSD
jgi:hypothetical protein